MKIIGKIGKSGGRYMGSGRDYRTSLPGYFGYRAADEWL